MPFVTEHGNDAARLILSGHVTVAEAAALHAALVELLPVSGSVTLDDSRVAGFDVSLLQLLVAFVRARRAAGRPCQAVLGPAGARLGQLGMTADLPELV
jgi:ABC-type transporter Mla MlaB component